jgi:hypothetical protein
METSANNPNGTGESVQDAANAFASILTVLEDGEQKQGEAQPESEALAEDDGSGDETEATQEAEEESQSEGEEESEEQEEQPPVYRVKIDGDEVEVTLDELQKGYSRTQDYTRKTQALAEQRKTAEAELETVRQERAYYAQMLQAMQAQLTQGEPQPDWNKLYEENPHEWVRQRELWRDKQEKAQAVRAEQERLQAIQQQELGKLRQEQLAKEAEKLTEAIPEWKDSKRAAEERAKLVDAARRVGYTDGELNEVMDHRAVVLLRKAALYDELMGKKTQIKPVPAKGPRLATPGSATTKPSKKSEAMAAQERLAKTGNLKDAAAAFDQFI